MPTKRFETLEPERKRVLLDAAAAEFAAHGYEGASFNRIIERAGTSKGAIYYWFEDKADLYATVVRDAVTRLVDRCGPTAMAPDAASFWTGIQRMTERALRFYREDPQIAGLVRSLVRDGLPHTPVAEIRELTAAWLSQLVLVGQAVGAIRTDLPMDLILSVGTAVTEGFDLWLVQHVDELDDAALDRLAATMTDVYRRMSTPVEVP